MITFWTGLPGSGKTYRSVEFLHSVFLDDKSKDYNKFKFFFTNINEFKFEIFPENIGIRFDYDSFYSTLTELYIMAVVNKANDTELLEVASKYNFKDSIIIVDECHNYFDSDDKILVWWLSYHRHLHQDIFLITQNLELVHKKYYSFSEFYYKAMPTSLRLFKSNFYYKLYTSPKLYQKTFVETMKLKFNPKVYELYHSGQNHQTKNIIYKMGGIILFLVILAFAFFYYISYSYSSKGSSEKKETPQGAAKNIPTISPIKEENKNNNNPLKTKDYYYFYCVNSECSGNNQIIELQFLQSSYNIENVTFEKFYNIYKVTSK